MNSANKIIRNDKICHPCKSKLKSLSSRLVLTKKFNQMKKLTLFIIAAMSMFMLSSCKRGPVETTKEFYKNVQLCKVDEAKKYCTESAGQLIDLTMSLGAKPNPDYKMENFRDSVSGDHAWVWFTNEKGNEEKFELVKVDGEWLVSFSK